MLRWIRICPILGPKICYFQTYLFRSFLGPDVTPSDLHVKRICPSITQGKPLALLLHLDDITVFLGHPSAASSSIASDGPPEKGTPKDIRR
jgi:hypothetical protein